LSCARTLWTTSLHGVAHDLTPHTNRTGPQFRSRCAVEVRGAAPPRDRSCLGGAARPGRCAATSGLCLHRAPGSGRAGQCMAHRLRPVAAGEGGEH
jgi:hypothetical protein